MKVRIRYSDGTYTMYPWCPNTTHPKVPWTYTEIPYVIWLAYRFFLWIDCKWHGYMLRLSNEQYGREHNDA